MSKPTVTSLVVAVLLLSPTAFAEADRPSVEPPETPPAAVSSEPQKEPTWRIAAEVDPLDYALYHGWGGFISVRHSALSKWRFRLGAGAASLPQAAVDANAANKGWGFRLDPVATLVAHYTFFGGRGGFFAGPGVSLSRLVFTAPSDAGQVDATAVTLGMDVGYRWYPFEKLGLVITPHVGVLLPLYLSRKPIVADATYQVPPLLPQPQILVGYEFDL